MTSEPVLLERRNTGPVRLYGLAATVIPALAGAWLLVRGGSSASTAVGVAAVVLALVVLRTNLRFAGRIEIDGALARVTTLWLGSKRDVDLEKLASVRVRPQASPAPAGGAPVLSPATYHLAFTDGETVFLAASDFDGAERLVERAMRAPAEGFAFPVQLASACLVAWVRYLDDPRLGCSASYAVEGGMLSIYVYRGDAASLPDGPESEAIDAELDKACGDVRNLAARTQTPVQELERGVSGEGGPLPMRKAAFAIDGQTSYVYLTGHAGRFLKARFTGPASAEGSITESLAALAAHLRA